jgi:hypothetical protein
MEAQEILESFFQILGGLRAYEGFFPLCLEIPNFHFISFFCNYSAKKVEKEVKKA